MEQELPEEHARRLHRPEEVLLHHLRRPDPHQHRFHRVQGLQLRCRLHRWPYLHRPLRPGCQGRGCPRRRREHLPGCRRGRRRGPVLRRGQAVRWRRPDEDHHPVQEQVRGHRRRRRDREPALRRPQGLLRRADDPRSVHLHAGEPERYRLLRQGGSDHRPRHHPQRVHRRVPRPPHDLRLHRLAVQGLDLGSRRRGLPRPHGPHRDRLLLPVQRDPAVQPGCGPDVHRGHPDHHRLRHQR